MTVNGDLTLNTTSAVTKIAGGTTFATAHLAASATDLGFAPGQTLAATILFEGAVAGTRHVEMNGTAGSFTIGATRRDPHQCGLTGDGDIGGGLQLRRGDGAHEQRTDLLAGQRPDHHPQRDELGQQRDGHPGGHGWWHPDDRLAELEQWGQPAGADRFDGELERRLVQPGRHDHRRRHLDAEPGRQLRDAEPGHTEPDGREQGQRHRGWNNSGQSFTFNAATGSWTLNGGIDHWRHARLRRQQTLVIAANTGNLLSGVTVNGDLTLNTTSAVTKIAGGTTFTTAHLAASADRPRLCAGADARPATILFEGAVAGTRHVEMNGTAGSFTIGATGVIRTNAGLTGDGDIGGGFNFGGAMALTNNGLISSQVSGRTITLNPATSFTNAGTLEATNGGILAVPLGYTQTAGITRVSGGGTISAFEWGRR